LILDPFIRLHRVEENDASQIAPLLSFLRQLQRRFAMAVALVHHARKDAGNQRPGQALRGTSELHGWGDSNLYLRRQNDRLTLTTEHRAAASQERIGLQLSQAGPALALSVITPTAGTAPTAEPVASAKERVRQILTQAKDPISVQRLRQRCGMKTASVCAALAELSDQGLVTRNERGVQLRLALEEPLVARSSPAALGAASSS
jgi:biotin operon repressor